MKIQIPLAQKLDLALDEKKTNVSISKSTTKTNVDQLLVDEIQDRQKRLKPGIWKK